MSQWAVGNRRRQRRRSVKSTLSANTLAYGTAPSRGAHTDYDAVLRDEFWDSILATYREHILEPHECKRTQQRLAQLFKKVDRIDSQTSRANATSILKIYILRQWYARCHSPLKMQTARSTIARCRTSAPSTLQPGKICGNVHKPNPTFPWRK